MSYLELRQVDMHYGNVQALKAVSLAVEQGERFGLLGPSGSGKTTLLRLIAGLEHTQSGQIVLDSQTISSPGRRLPPERRGIALVFQSLGLWPHLAAREHLDLVLRRRLRAKDERKAEIAHLLNLARLRGKEHRRPGELSGGEQQRLALARAVAQRPRLLLLDEPFAHVDEPLRDALSEALIEILQACSATAIIVSHDGPHLAALCHRLAVMGRGQALQQGTFQDLYRAPSCATVARMTGPAFLVHGQSDSAAAHTAIGAIPLHPGSPGGQGAACLRPENFELNPGTPAAPTFPATTLRSTFSAGRWKVYFDLKSDLFWTWDDRPHEAGQSLSLSITPAAFIPGGLHEDAAATP